MTTSVASFVSICTSCQMNSRRMLSVTGYESFCSTPCEPKYAQFSSVGNSVRREGVHSTRTSRGLNAVGMIMQILLGVGLQVHDALRLLEARRKRQTRRVRFALAHGQIGHPPSEP